MEVTEPRAARVGDLDVYRALPRRARRTIGAWCFVDVMGPAAVTEDHGIDVGPHPHIGLQTVTWLIRGEALHRDSLGSEQVIRPGQLNLMTAGRGISHSEEATGSYRGDLWGVQLWVAQPESTRHGDPAFEHQPELPEVELPGASGTVLVGSIAGATSPARRDTDHLGVDLVLRAGTTVVPLDPGAEHGIVALDGPLVVAGEPVAAGNLAYVGPGRDELPIEAAGTTRALLVGGVPFESPVLMWWNYVARERAEIVDAHRSWTERDGRFGTVASPLAAIDVGPPPWSSANPS